METFLERLDAAAERNRSLLCVGLDPWPPAMPVADVAAFNRAIIGATSDLVCAYKPQWAFYEAEGVPGLRALEATIEAVPDGMPIILDVKRGDLGNTSVAYAKAVFETWGADAVTVNPYQGRDSLQPFLAYADKGVFILTRTSNPGGFDFQALPVRGADGAERPLYEEVARQAMTWNDLGNIGLVAGATAPEELARVRLLAGEAPMLIPGVGAQGGDLERAVRNGADANGRRAVITAARSVLTPRAARISRRRRGRRPCVCATASTRNWSGWARDGEFGWVARRVARRGAAPRRADHAAEEAPVRRRGVARRAARRGHWRPLPHLRPLSADAAPQVGARCQVERAAGVAVVRWGVGSRFRGEGRALGWPVGAALGIGAEGRIRTGMRLPSTVFETAASTLPPLRPAYDYSARRRIFGADEPPTLTRAP